jgi:hypothetical protein
MYVIASSISQKKIKIFLTLFHFKHKSQPSKVCDDMNCIILKCWWRPQRKQATDEVGGRLW